MNTNCKLFASLPSTDNTDMRRRSMGRLFGSCIKDARENASLSIEEAAQLSGMELSEWMAVEDGIVPQELNRLRAMAEAMQVNFDHMASWILVCRAAWEN
jgi:transcriptional regulator with XRE-family HTH domain